MNKLKGDIVVVILLTFIIFYAVKDELPFVRVIWNAISRLFS